MSASTDSEYKLSLSTAILININIMLGAGIFINTPTLAERTGIFGGGMYLLIALLMLPLILSMAQLVRLHPAGGFYTYARTEIHPLAGFLSGWSYFTAKLSSCILMIHASVLLLQHIFPPLTQISSFALDISIICLFTMLNLLNVKAGGMIQKIFIGFKAIPIFFVIGTCFFMLQGENFSASHWHWEGIPTSLPLVIYAIVGFEAACSISSKIKDPQKNAPLAILISFFTVIGIATIYQTLFYGALGQKLAECLGHCDTLPALIVHLFGDTPWSNNLIGLLHLALACSTLGAAYGVIFSNCWNLHVLAQNKHIWLSKTFALLNKNSIPICCVFAEGLICIIYLFGSQGVLIPLQQISALGCVIAYSISVVALLQATKSNKEVTISRWIPLCGLVSCTILISACIRSFFINGMTSFIVFGALLIFGACMYFSCRVREKETEEDGEKEVKRESEEDELQDLSSLPS